MVRSSYGEVPIDIPRDSHAKFEPKAIRKHEKDCNEFDKKIMGLYDRGMFTRDIQSELEELYGIDIYHIKILIFSISKNIKNITGKKISSYIKK